MARKAQNPLLAPAAALVCAAVSHAADWPQYRGGPARGGYTAEALPARLSLCWVRHARHAPCPAWRGRSFARSRMRFDWSYSAAVANGVLCFGSSADCKVYALDAATGRMRWSFFTGGPVRFAPAFWKDRVFAVSDDGFLYCLKAQDGALLWKLRAGPDADRLLGNGRMVSRWVARGGPAVRDGVVYWGAGIWPTDGVHVYAVRATDGKVLWHNDNSGIVAMQQPHLYTYSRSGVASQGYLAVTRDRVFVATGRAVPAAFDRKTGRFLYFHLSRYGGKTPWGAGGGDVVATDSVFFSGGYAFDTATGLTYHKVGRWAWWKGARKNGRRLTGKLHKHEHQVIAATPDGFIRSEGAKAFASTLVRKTYQHTREDDFLPKPQKRHVLTIENAPVMRNRWSLPTQSQIESLVVAGKTAALGMHGSVSLVDCDTGKTTWSAQVDGVARSMAAAGGRLYVSTDKGTIYSFSGRAVGQTAHIKPNPAARPYPDDGRAARAADEIIRRTGVTKGYCLDIGCGDGALAYELARRTDLYVVAIDPDPAHVAQARRKLDAAGLYGVRVVVLQGDLAGTHLPDYFANLIVSSAALSTGADALPTKDIARLQRPYGGALCLGRQGQMVASVRGELERAGRWTHQFADAGNTMSSGDMLIRGPLGVLWYQDETLDTVQRHGKGPSPLFYKGVLVRLGIDAVRAMDAYNGHRLWEFPLPGILERYDEDSGVGAAQTGGIHCVADGIVTIRRDTDCLLLDVFTGKNLGSFAAAKLPDGRAGHWTFIARKDGIIFGGLANENHVIKSVHAHGTAKWQVPMDTVYTESSLLFALDANTGEVKWTWLPKESVRNNAVAVGAGRVFVIDREPAEIDKMLKSEVQKRRGKKLPLPKQPAGELVALDAATGAVEWRDSDSVSGTMLALSLEHDALLTCYQKANWALQSDVSGRSMRCFRASDGQRLWTKQKAWYGGRPIIIDRTVYGFPFAWDLLTGKPRTRGQTGAGRPGKAWRINGKSFGCAPQTGSGNLIMMRSGTLAYYDLAYDSGWLENFGGARPGCWVNAIAVGGLLLMPEDTRGCRCSYVNQATLALQHYGVRPPLVLPMSPRNAVEFAETITVSMSHPDRDVEIRYTLDDTYPTAASRLYDRPIILDRTTAVRAAVFKGNRKLAERDAVTFARRESRPSEGGSPRKR